VLISIVGDKFDQFQENIKVRDSSCLRLEEAYFETPPPSILCICAYHGEDTRQL
jgi:hypothetical protein